MADDKDKDESKILEKERRERLARLSFKLHDTRSKAVLDTNETLRSMLRALGYGPADDQEFLWWKKKFLEETEEIEVTEFVDFFHNVVDLCRLDVAGAKRAMQEIISNHSEDGRKSKAKTVDYINQKTLLEEMNLSMLSEDIDLAQVLTIIREIDSTGLDRDNGQVIDLSDFYRMMDVQISENNEAEEA